MNPIKKISIPEPCHENWDEMTPKERGRHCEKCDKVVRDFSGASREDIFREADAKGESVCGRVPVQLLDERPGEGVFFRFPVARLRVFLLAFLATFGWTVWGISEGKAASLVAVQNLVEDSEALNHFLSPADSVIKIRGQILDVESGEPLVYATVVIEVGGEVITGAYSNSEGHFSLLIDSGEFPPEQIQVRARYMGNEVVQQGIPEDASEMRILISTDFLMDPVVIEGRQNELLGDIIMGGIRPSVHSIDSYWRRYNWYFNPENDFIQMRRSDVYYLEGAPAK